MIKQRKDIEAAVAAAKKHGVKQHPRIAQIKAWVPPAVVERGAFDLTPEVLARSAQDAYERFLKELGMQHDARLRDWDKLSYMHQVRWVRIARAALEAAGFHAITPSGGEDQCGSEGSVQHAPSGGKLRPDNGAPAKEVPEDRGSSARRRRKV